MAVYPTMLSDLLAELHVLLAKHGDMPVAAHDCERHTCAKVSARVEEYYYDSGILYPAEQTGYHCQRWTRSKTTPVHARHLIISSDGPLVDEGDAIDGVPYRSTADDA